MPKMQPRKEPKETVTYPASKRKAPPFKPQRPSKVPRVATTESESSTRATKSPTAAAKKPKATPIKAAARTNDTRQASDGSARKRGRPPKKPVLKDSEDDEGEGEDVGMVHNPANEPSSEDSDDGLDDNPLATVSKKPVPKRKPPARQPSPMAISSEDEHGAGDLPDPSAADPNPPSALSQSDTIPTIPQPLLIRLMHEHFANKQTKIDKHAIQVLQKYFEVFVREAIARAALQKREDASTGKASQSEVGWLELEDLEKVAGGMLLDF